MTINADVQKLEPGAIVDLFKLDASGIGSTVMRFHRHTHLGPIWWNDEEYSPWPVETEGFELSSDRPPSPKLTVANLDGSISLLCYQHDDLIGSVVTRYRTLGAYLDAVNFADPDQLVNGSFRDDTAGWTTSGGTGLVWLTRCQARAQGTAIATKSYQDVTVVAGQQYLVKAMLVNRIGTSRVRVYDGAAFTTTLDSMTQAGITNYVIVTPTTTTLRVSVEADLGDEITVGGLMVQKYIGNPTADPDEEFPPEVWYIDRKASETNQSIQFELASALDLNGVMLPRRQIVANYCSWKSIGGYRGAYCGYTGAPVAKADGTPTIDPLEDDCGGKVSDCKLRDWPDDVLNYGGFAAAGLVRT